MELVGLLLVGGLATGRVEMGLIDGAWQHRPG